MLTCPNCATPAVAGARFCFACGTSLEVTPLIDTEADSERRTVTVLFGDLSDFTGWAEDLDPERVGVVVDRVLAALTKSVTDFGGYVDKLTGDGIMAIFGAPVAHEDDPERAIRAAAAMQQEVLALVADETGGGRSLGLRVGINTGEVLAGVQAQVSYTVVGDTVNTAARLSDAASVGTTVAGRETALATMHLAAWRALKPLRLKGKREPVPAYELVGLRTRIAHRLGLGEAAPFIGREAELGVLVERLTDVVEQAHPSTLLVVGEAGVGKTRLVAELSRHAGDALRARVLWGRCTPYGEGRDLAPIAEMIRTVCGLAPDEDRLSAITRVHRAVSRLVHPSAAGAVAAALADRLLDLLGFGEDAEATMPRTPATPGEPEGRRVRLGLDAVVELLRSLVKSSPLVIVVDDLHWANDALIDALRSVGARLEGRVLLIGIGRTDHLTLADDWAGSLPEPYTLMVGPLESIASGRLLRGYLGGVRLDGPATRMLVDRAQGNPFFLGELLNFLVDRGVLREDEGTWRLDGELPEELPAGIQAVLTARIDELDHTTKSMLRDAAVLGGRFPVAGLVALGHGNDSTAVAEALAHLETRHIVTPADPDAVTYDFVHTLARDVAYAGLPKGERARRHSAAARWLSTLEPASEDLDQRIATQAIRALELATEMQLPLSDEAWSAREVGFEALLRSGHHALGRDDYLPAKDYLKRALAFSQRGLDDETWVSASLAYAEALAGLREVTEAEQVVVPLLDAPTLDHRIAALVILGDVRRKQGNDDEAQVRFEEAADLARTTGNSRLLGEALRHLGMLDYRQGRMLRAEERFTEAKALAERTGDQRGVGWALQHLAWSATTRGDYALADQALDEGMAVFSEMADSGGISWCLGTEALVRLLECRLLEARGIIAGLLPVAEVMGDRWSEAACLTIDALAAAELGEARIAELEAVRARGLFHQTGDTWGVALAEVAEGNAARGLGDPVRAETSFREALLHTSEGSHPLVASLARVTLGTVLLTEGRLDEAEEQSELALESLSTVDMEPHAAVGSSVLQAQVLRARGQAAKAVEILRDCVARTEVSSLLFPRRQVLSHLAGGLLDLGETEQAYQMIQEAMACPAEDVRSQVVALRVLANVLRAKGDEDAARAAIEQALAVATAAGHAGEAELTRRHL